MKYRPCYGLWAFVLLSIACGLHAGVGETNNPAIFEPPPGDLFAVFIRMLGALAVVVGIFLAGAWFFRKSRLFGLYQSGPPQLKILETRSLGYRNALFVVGYQHRRFLLATSSTGVNLVSPLPDAVGDQAEDEKGGTFSEHLDAVKEQKS